MKRRNALKKKQETVITKKKEKIFLCNKKSRKMKKISSGDYVYGQRPIRNIHKHVSAGSGVHCRVFGC
jgi:hypothetical protein